MQLTAGKPSVNIGTVTLPTDAIMLGEAVIVAEAPQVTISEDTIGYKMCIRDSYCTHRH